MSNSKKIKDNRRGRSKKKKNRNSWKNQLLYTIGFLFLISIFIVCIGYLKNNFYYSINDKEIAEKNRLDTYKLNSYIDKIDNLLIKVFFELEVSKSSIYEDKNYKREKEGISWNLNKKKIHLNSSITKDKLISIFNKNFDDPQIIYEVKQRNKAYTTEIRVKGLKSHDIVFLRQDFKEDRDKLTKRDGGSDSSLSKHTKTFRIVIIVDDLGGDKHSINKLINIPANLTFAVLPNLPYSKYNADVVTKSGKELILHLPMEPKLSSGYDAQDAGEGVLLVGQTKQEIMNNLENSLNLFPNIVGVNNHMGSKFTESEELMKVVIQRLKKSELYFIDSLTSNKSTGYYLARSMGVETARRDIFLDSRNRGKEYFSNQFRSLVKKSRRNGYAIGICHPYPQTIEALTEEIRKLDGDVKIAFASEVVK